MSCSPPDAPPPMPPPDHWSYWDRWLTDLCTTPFPDAELPPDEDDAGAQPRSTAPDRSGDPP